MKLETRLLVTYLVRFSFLFAGWVALRQDAIPGVDQVTRIGLAAQFLVLSIVIGETNRLHTQFELLVRALRAAGAKVTLKGMPADNKEAVGILIRALASREETTREKAHRNLVRLTGQDLPPDKAAWEAWWKENAVRFEATADDDEGVQA